MEKNDIIIILQIFIIILLVFRINRIETKKENYDTGYNQNTTFRDCQRKLFITDEDFEFLNDNKSNNKLNNNKSCDCSCNLQHLKVHFTNNI
jgi:beta-lactamase superfamily II metal-dependent hydrolase